MRQRNIRFWLACGAAFLMTMGAFGCATPEAATPTPGDGLSVRVVPDTVQQRVDVLVGDDLFTAYLYADTLAVLKKPVLYPIRTASGVAVTRGFPLEARPGERTDHPHHIGLWFNYGDVNGLDFWNNSDAVSPERASKMGTIRHREVRHVESGPGHGTLDVTMDWLAPDGTPVLREDTRFVFHATPDRRTIDRITTLTALDEGVSFEDNKEGVLGLRLTRALEMPTARPVNLTGADGSVTRVLDNEGVTGHYRNSEGTEGYPDVWGQRARWMTLSGVVEGDSVTIAILDHPQNVGFPTYWHARDYGLFAANPFGQAIFSEGAESLHFALAPRASTTLRHRIILFSGHPAPDDVEAHYEQWR